MTAVRPRAPILVPGVVGAVSLVLAEFTDLYAIRSRGETVATVGAGPHHGYALLVLGVAALALTWLAARADAPRLPGLALLLVGVAALFVVLVIDVPDLGAEGAFGTIADPASARAGAGFLLETAGAVLVVLAGGLTVAGPRG